VLVLTAVAPAASADPAAGTRPTAADGCTFANGAALSHECITVSGHGVQVTTVASGFYYAETGSFSANACDRHHEVAYYTAAGRLTREIDPPGCVNSFQLQATGDAALFDFNIDLAPNTPICTRARNSATAQQWTPYACEQIVP
jgi:hypothetical protein